MMIPNRKFVPLVITALILVAGTAAPGLPYKGVGGHFNATGGTFSGGAYKTVGLLGVNTHGPSSSAGYTNQEGVLAFFGRPFFEADASALDFGLVATGNSRTMSATVKNYGGVGLLISNLRLAHVGADTVFTIESPAAATVGAPGDSGSWVLRFAPPARTPYSARPTRPHRPACARRAGRLNTLRLPTSENAAVPPTPTAKPKVSARYPPIGCPTEQPAAIAAVYHPIMAPLL